MLLANPMVPMKVVCRAEDIDEAAAERYLRIVRYLDTRPREEKRALLCDSSTTIQALTTTINLRMRGGVWRDDGERPTAAGLLRELVPVLDAKAAYIMGKQLRETAYHLYEAHSDVTVMGSKAATIMSIRQFACIQVRAPPPPAATRLAATPSGRRVETRGRLRSTGTSPSSSPRLWRSARLRLWCCMRLLASARGVVCVRSRARLVSVYFFLGPTATPS